MLKELEEPHPHDRIKLFPDTPPASPSDQSSETSVKASPSPSSSNTSTPDLKQTHSGNYNPENGLIFRALNMIENEIFYRDETEYERKSGIVTKALMYLEYF